MEFVFFLFQNGRQGMNKIIGQLLFYWVNINKTRLKFIHAHDKMKALLECSIYILAGFNCFVWIPMWMLSGGERGWWQNSYYFCFILITTRAKCQIKNKKKNKDAATFFVFCFLIFTLKISQSQMQKKWGWKIVLC